MSIGYVFVMGWKLELVRMRLPGVITGVTGWYAGQAAVLPVQLTASVQASIAAPQTVLDAL